MARDKVDPIEELFGRDTADYVLRKNRGGCSSARGLEYENVYAVAKIADLCEMHSDDLTNVVLKKQSMEFVDDLQIVFRASPRKEDYQLKDKRYVSWTANKAQLRRDFCRQQQLNTEHHNCDSSQYLVVSSEQLAGCLRTSVPIAIRAHSNVEVFPSPGHSANKLLSTAPQVRASVSNACCCPNELDKVEAVFAALYSAWSFVPPNTEISLGDIVDRARSFGNYVRVTNDVPPIPGDVQDIFNAIDGFEYCLMRGYFQWRYLRTDSGVLPFDCLHSNYAKFLELVRTSNPTYFDELALLLYS